MDITSIVVAVILLALIAGRYAWLVAGAVGYMKQQSATYNVQRETDS